MTVAETLRQLAQSAPAVGGASVNYRPEGKTPTFCVHHEWSLNLYNLRGWIHLPEHTQRYPLKPGTVCLMPPGTRRQFSSQRRGAQWVVHFRPPVAIDGELILFEVGTALRELSFLARSIATTTSPERRQAVAWHLLWRLQEIWDKISPNPSGHSVLDQACAHMREHLAQPLAIAEVAKAIGCSHNHLTRLFRSYLQTTAVAWLRQERMAKAMELLKGTDMAIKTIGQEIGLGDPQHFNKTFRRHFGKAPSAFR